MAKELSEMNNEELWKLFPIIISDHRPEWKDLYTQEKDIIEKAIGKQNISRINHFGSTSVRGLCAKPTIDILLEIFTDTDTDRLSEILTGIGYIRSNQKDNPPPHMMFLKGYTPEGFKGQAYHLHIRYEDDWDELYFRDYLIDHPDTAKEYGELKVRSKGQFEHDRDAYTEEKSQFIKENTRKARIEQGCRYKIKR